MSHKKALTILSIVVIAVLVTTACGGSTQAPPETEAPSAEEAEHMDEDEHMEDEHMEDEHSPEEHMEGEHDVPEEAAEVPNPIEVSEASVAEGANLYAANCAVCHGEEGEGDGPTAETLDPKPADLHEDHVQDLTDGALFYIISHGRPMTSMPAWENQLNEDERWHVVNFLRTFKE